MFSSNVAPRRTIRAAHKAWYCDKCVRQVEKFWLRCPSCGHKRP